MAEMAPQRRPIGSAFEERGGAVAAPHRTAPVPAAVGSIHGSPRVASLRAIGERLNSGPRVAALGGTGRQINKPAHRPAPVVQRAVIFAAETPPTVKSLVGTALMQSEAMANDPTFVLQFTASDALPEGVAATTEYAILVKGELHALGKSLAAAYAKAEAEKPEKLYVYITYNPKEPELAQSAALAHEIALHAQPFYAYRHVLLGGSGAALDAVKGGWPELVSKGELSEELQHLDFGSGNVDLYAAMVKAQMGRLKKPAQQGQIAFFFITDYLSKLMAYMASAEHPAAKRAVLLKERAWLLELTAPYEAKGSDKSGLAKGFEGTLAKIHAFKAEGQGAAAGLAPASGSGSGKQEEKGQ